MLDLEVDRPHPARVYDYILGGGQHFASDRAAAEDMLKGWPDLRMSMQQNRRFMHRVVAHLAGDVGIRQFLDIGAGIPTSPNAHEIAQRIAPDSRVVYVDNDPIARAHALEDDDLSSHSVYLQADFRDPAGIFAAPDLLGTLDLSRPVAVLVIAMVQFIGDDEAYDLVRSTMEKVPPGSYLALTTVTADSNPTVARIAQDYTDHGMPMYVRDHKSAEQFFDGLDLVAPGVVLAHHWPTLVDGSVRDAEVGMYAGLARKP
ncbi:SAM-dependent methyltransferase [Kribbella sp. NPDC056861]|uniref:SAM-dependent methyltransferase n=1 Tax=Kribbella sp. NPDC056861 TaxID=3154857 RepID=UPI00342E08D0